VADWLIPLHNRAGEVVAHTLVDAEDRHLAALRWYLDAGNAARSGKPYVRRARGGRAVYLHRQILGLRQDDPRKGDHINGDTLDNRRANLRIVTVAENAQNQGSRGGSSRHRGVCWDKARGKWMAQAGGRTLGRFDSEDEAAAVASAWRAEHMPFSQDAAA
jgi:hypothetical protein